MTHTYADTKTVYIWDLSVTYYTDSRQNKDTVKDNESIESDSIK